MSITDELIDYLQREIDRAMEPPLWFEKLSDIEQGEWFADARRACDMLAYELWRVKRAKRRMELELACLQPLPHFIPHDRGQPWQSTCSD